MPDFQYTARETSGQQTTGVLTASSKQDALNVLATQSLFPIRIDLAESTKSEQKYVGKRVSPRHLCVFYTQLSDLLRSGVPLFRSLDLLSKQSVNPTLKLVIQDVREQERQNKHRGNVECANDKGVPKGRIKRLVLKKGREVFQSYKHAVRETVPLHETQV